MATQHTQQAEAEAETVAMEVDTEFAIQAWHLLLAGAGVLILFSTAFIRVGTLLQRRRERIDKQIEAATEESDRRKDIEHKIENLESNHTENNRKFDELKGEVQALRQDNTRQHNDMRAFIEKKFEDLSEDRQRGDRELWQHVNQPHRGLIARILG